MPRFRKLAAPLLAGVLVFGPVVGCGDDVGEDEIGDGEIDDNGD